MSGEILNGQADGSTSVRLQSHVALLPRFKCRNQTLWCRAYAVTYSDLPPKCARPSHGNIPAAYISMIGVDQRFAGRGYGGDLLVDAIKRIARAADAFGMTVVILDVLDDGNASLVARRKSLYESYGFAALFRAPFASSRPEGLVRSMIEGRSRRATGPPSTPGNRGSETGEVGIENSGEINVAPSTRESLDKRVLYALD